MRLPRLAAALLSSAIALTAGLAQAETRGVSDKEIIIGTYTDLSGVTAMWGVNNSNAWRMVFDEVNAEGGINGRKIKYIVEDNQYQVPRSVQAANKLINHDGVFIMVANGGTPMNNAVMPDQLAKGVANVFPLTSARSMYEPLHHLKFGLGSSYYDQIRAGVKYFVEKRGKKRICVARQDTDFGRDVGDGVHDELKAENMTEAAETLHKPTDTDFSASVARLRDANCDLVVIGGIVRDTVQIISAIRKTGWNVDLLGQAASYDDAIANVPGGVTEGFYSMAPMLFVTESSTDPKVKAFVAKYEKLYGKTPNFAAQIGYTGAQVTVQALKNAGKDLTPDSFVAGMEAIKDYHDIFGSPTISFSKTKHQGSNESFLCVIKDGKWTTAEPTPMGY
ncbi:ABC transporter substrate-binding protein [Rhodopila sp.]|uniref:ABC transporter substrate-binding protein n=1 Tax=Rhodopila sp. TaxID=2480087 RepID=UPI002CC7FA13|nr:ABC transporter substrate-binding protein [Rhodopila sp.]HVZ10319.1 ABC transporter substrate-binding protein [Rhodopila sp.]